MDHSDERAEMKNLNLRFKSEEIRTGFEESWDWYRSKENREGVGIRWELGGAGRVDREAAEGQGTQGVQDGNVSADKCAGVLDGVKNAIAQESVAEKNEKGQNQDGEKAETKTSNDASKPTTAGTGTFTSPTEEGQSQTQENQSQKPVNSLFGAAASGPGLFGGGGPGAGSLFGGGLGGIGGENKGAGVGLFGALGGSGTNGTNGTNKSGGDTGAPGGGLFGGAGFLETV